MSFVPLPFSRVTLCGLTVLLGNRNWMRDDCSFFCVALVLYLFPFVVLGYISEVIFLLFNFMLSVPFLVYVGFSVILVDNCGALVTKLKGMKTRLRVHSTGIQCTVIGRVPIFTDRRCYLLAKVGIVN
jgi:hypothetical protein